MSALKKITAMLDSVGARHTTKTEGSTVTVQIPIPGGGYDVDVLFSNGGKDFLSSVVRITDNALCTLPVSGKLSRNRPCSLFPVASAGDDYSEIVNMVTQAPVKKGQYQEAKSNDGKYVGLLYQDFDCDYGVAFVCIASNRKFIGIVGF